MASENDDIQKRAFDYLNNHLDPELKKRLTPQVLKGILRCISEWIVSEKDRKFFKELESCESFYDELEKF